MLGEILAKSYMIACSFTNKSFQHSEECENRTYRSHSFPTLLVVYLKRMCYLYIIRTLETETFHSIVTFLPLRLKVLLRAFIFVHKLLRNDTLHTFPNNRTYNHELEYKQGLACKSTSSNMQH